MTTLYLVRHGQVENNIKRLMNGVREDQPLNEMGKAQVATLERPFAFIQPDAVYTSPLVRARQTAKALCGKRRIPITDDKRLLEIDLGQWEGKPLADLNTLFPKTRLQWSMPFDNFVAEDVSETMKMAADRIEQAALDAVEKHRGGKVVFTAHGGIIRMLLIRLFGGAMAGFHRYPYLPNASITAFEIEDDGEVRLMFMGNCDHIPNELMTIQPGYVQGWMWREHVWQALRERSAKHD